MTIKRIWRVLLITGGLLIVFSMGGLVIAQNERTFTPGELAKFNGQNGASVYVAVSGLVYDLSAVPEWAKGRHYCSGAIAGKDITFLWNLVPSSHKNAAFLKRFPEVGRMVAVKSTTPLPATPRSPVSKGSSIAVIIIEALGIAVIITLGWLLFRLKKK